MDSTSFSTHTTSISVLFTVSSGPVSPWSHPVAVYDLILWARGRITVNGHWMWIWIWNRNGHDQDRRFRLPALPSRRGGVVTCILPEFSNNKQTLLNPHVPSNRAPRTSVEDRIRFLLAPDLYCARIHLQYPSGQEAMCRVRLVTSHSHNNLDLYNFFHTAIPVGLAQNHVS